MSDRKRVFLVAGLVLLTALAALLWPAPQQVQPREGFPTWDDRLAANHLPWLANVGQADSHVDFYAQSCASTVFVTCDGAIVHALPGVALEESFVGARRVRATGRDRSRARIHAYRGNQRYTDIPAYDRIRLAGVYEGIDVDLRVRPRGVEKLLRVRPGADPATIRLRVEGAAGLRATAAGTLEMNTPRGPIMLSRPVAYQEGEPVPVSYDVRDDTYGFRVEGHDPARELVIDPVLEATFLGGTGNNPETAWAVALDADGKVYVAGATPSPDFPHTTGTFLGGGYEAFVGKLSPDLSTLEVGTFLGGGAIDIAVALAIHGDSLFVAGESNSGGLSNAPKFPATAGAFQPDVALIPGIGSIAADCFVAKLSLADLTIEAATYFGGRWSETCYGLDLDSEGNVFITGSTDSNESTDTNGKFFPVLGDGYDHTHNGSGDTFVAKLSNDLTTGIASTYLGGVNSDTPHALRVDADDKVVVGGRTSSPDFPNDATLGLTGGYLARLSNDLASLEASVLTGRVRGIALDDGDLVVAFRDDDGTFPTTTGAFDRTHNGGPDVVVARLAGDFSAILAATYLGGGDSDFLGTFTAGLAVDSTGGIVIGGWTASTNFPTTPAAEATSYQGGTYDAFVARLSPDLTALDYSTFLGGSQNEELQALALDGDDHAVVAGLTFSADFPVSTGAYQTEPNINLTPTSGSPGSDGYVARVMTRDQDGDGVVDAEEMGPNGDDPTYDGNADGTPDHEQSHVCSFFTDDAANYVTIECPAGSTLVDVEAIPTPGTGRPPDQEFRYDLFRFCVLVPNPGDSVQVTLHLPASPNSYWKLGPSGWFKFDYDGTTGAQINGTQVTLTFVDGGRGDNDGAQDGKVTDPGGPAFDLAGSLPPQPPPPAADGPRDSDCVAVVIADGSWLDADLNVLRDFRDEWLLPTAAGSAFVRFYYRHSPAAAAYVAERPVLRVALRLVLAPVIYAIKYPWAMLALVLGAAWWIRRRRRSRRRTAVLTIPREAAILTG